MNGKRITRSALPALRPFVALVWASEGTVAETRERSVREYAVGLAPKTYLRVLRFQRALRALRHCQAASLASLAVQVGYSDQAHFNREFLEFAGVTPVTYFRKWPDEANHVPVDTPTGRHV